MTTTTRKAPARKAPASKSGNPAVAAAAKKAAEAAAAQEAEAQAAAAEQARAKFVALALPAPVFDEDGYEVIPEAEGGSYKFKVKGHPFVLPKLSHLPLAVAQQLRDAKTEEAAQALIFDRYAPDLYEYAGADELLHIMKRWMDYSKGVGLGE